MEKLRASPSDNGATREQLCPYIHTEHPECHCVNMTSAKITEVLKYCMLAYENCRIYKQFQSTST